MKQITFTITKEEVQGNCEEALSDYQLNEILATIENDHVFWKKIDEAIKSAIEVVQNFKTKE